jgi:hypothetical protein
LTKFHTIGIAVPRFEIHGLHDAKRRRNLTDLHLSCDELVVLDCVGRLEVDAIGPGCVRRPQNDNYICLAELALNLATWFRIRRKSIVLEDDVVIASEGPCHKRCRELILD